VSGSDVFVLQHVLWAHPDDAPVLRKWLLQALEGSPHSRASEQAAGPDDAGSEEVLPMGALGGSVASAGIAQATFLVEGLWAQACDLAAELDEVDDVRNSRKLLRDSSTSAGSSLSADHSTQGSDWHDRVAVLIAEARALEELLQSEHYGAIAAVHDLQTDSTTPAGDDGVLRGNVFLPLADIRLLRQRCVPTFKARAATARASANEAAVLCAALSTAMAGSPSSSDDSNGSSSDSSSSSSSSSGNSNAVPLEALLAALRAKSQSRVVDAAAGLSVSGSLSALTNTNKANGLPMARGKPDSNAITFTPEELAMSRKAAKASMKPDTFRAWRAAKKQSGEED